MKRVLPIFLGVLTAIGGFVDMGDLVAAAATGARCELNLAWVVGRRRDRDHRVRRDVRTGGGRGRAARVSGSRPAVGLARRVA
jgi:hypothetical protein